MSRNFYGCLRKIILRADNIRLDLLEMLNAQFLSHHNSYDHQDRSRSDSKNLNINHKDDHYGNDGMIYAKRNDNNNAVGDDNDDGDDDDDGYNHNGKKIFRKDLDRWNDNDAKNEIIDDETVGFGSNLAIQSFPSEMLDSINRNDPFNEHSLIRFYGNEIHNRSLSSTPISSNRFTLASLHHQCIDDGDVFDPITFTTTDSFLRLIGWSTPNSQSSLRIKIRTNEPNGIVLFADANGILNDQLEFRKLHNRSNTSMLLIQNYLALELIDGHLYLIISVDKSPIKIKATDRRIDDGHWHSITIRRSIQSGQVIVDETTSDFVLPNRNDRLNRIDTIYLGGIPNLLGHERSRMPPELWSISMGFGFIGCIKDLFFNDKRIDIATLPKHQDFVGVRPSCHSLSPQCSPKHPCQNGGQCLEGWNRYHCDCTQTSFTGSICTRPAVTMNFNGHQYVTILFPDHFSTQSEWFSLRFRTKNSDGLLLSTKHSIFEDHSMILSLSNGSLRLDYNNGLDAKQSSFERSITTIGQNFNDDQWHSFRLDRHGPNVQISIDSNIEQVIELIGQQFNLMLNSLYLGLANIDQTFTGNNPIVGFNGQMQNFVFNGLHYFEMIRDGQLSSNWIRMTAKMARKDRHQYGVVQFKSKNTFIGLSSIKAYNKLELYFQFKTTEPNGLILFNDGRISKQHNHQKNFIGIELINGILNYVIDLGDGPIRLQSNNRRILNDNRWHSVTIGRPSLYQHQMSIDDSLVTVNQSPNRRNLNLDLDELLYFGGVEDRMWNSLPRAIRSRTGFEGCIASVDLNGQVHDLIGKEVSIISDLVEAGCSGTIQRCYGTVCSKNGKCVKIWNNHGCNCESTTLARQMCSKSSAVYQFGSSSGLITFTFDEKNRPDTRNDLLILGFITNKKNGILVRIDSGTTSDYLQLEIIEGFVWVSYNLGTEDIDIEDLKINVNDDEYHMIRFTRSGQNSTLQIDNHNVLRKIPIGKHLNIFNRHSTIQIGGRRSFDEVSIEKPFNGIVADLIFNGHRLLQIASENDSRIKIDGDVELMNFVTDNNQSQKSSSIVLTTPTNQLNNQMLSEVRIFYCFFFFYFYSILFLTKKPKITTNSNDDLIQSNAGSDCFDVSEDEECAHIANEGSGDDLITPVYVSVNRFRPTQSNPNRVRVKENNKEENDRDDENDDDDDEEEDKDDSNNRYRNSWNRNCRNEDDDDDDCVEGSGDQNKQSKESRRYPQAKSQNNQYHYNRTQNRFDYYSPITTTTSRSTWITWVPPTVAPINQPPYAKQPTAGRTWNFSNTPPPFFHNSRNNFYGSNSVQSVHAILPKTTAPPWTKPVYSINGPIRPIIIPPIEPQGPPEIYDVPLNIPEFNENQTFAPDEDETLPSEILTRSNTDRTVIIISAIAILLILVVIIGPIILFYKVRFSASQSAYKIETFGPKLSSTMPLNGSSYPQFTPVVRATSVNAITGQPELLVTSGINSLGRPGFSRPGTRPTTPTVDIKKKDPHEWYV
ncbi:neuronal PAS domain-containing protein 4 [Sarcoptes scabiei]|nr:neuronal PAS domain-containing protein 4 [Sarcoptes scabiei]